MRSPQGEPWAVHVLRVSRRTKGVTIRAASAPGEMRRELPTAIAHREVRHGEELLAVVNGDYDLAAPYLGISDGFSITSGHLWTTGKATWPAMALRKNGEPVIAVPQMRMELRSGRQRWEVAALNKPLGSAHGQGPRAYTRDFRGVLQSGKPFRGIVVGNLSRLLPLCGDCRIRGEVTAVISETTQATIPADAIVIAEHVPEGASSIATPFQAASHSFTPGQKVELRMEASVGGRRDIAHVIGGFPIIVQRGKREIAGEPGANLKLRHPRTAVCYNQREIMFVVVDGRQPQRSVGMTLEELGDLMVSLGCAEAMNTDGGGSSVMAVTMPPPAGANHSGRGPSQIVNSPADGKERGRGNAWVILRRK
jgi:hypothetical protein